MRLPLTISTLFLPAGKHRATCCRILLQLPAILWESESPSDCRVPGGESYWHDLPNQETLMESRHSNEELSGKCPC